MSLTTAAVLTAGALPPAGGVPYTIERPFPTRDAAKGARDDAAYQLFLTAYRVWYPAVSIEWLHNGYRENGRPGRRNASAKRR
jgi:hypothetical protein